MNKSGLMLLVLAGMILFSVVNAAHVSAQAGGFLGEGFNQFISFFKDPKSADVTEEWIKLLFLIAIVVMVYSGLASAEFPENRGLRFILSAVLGLLFTIMITQEEILAAIGSYKAAGIAMILFLPLMALGFFTYTMVKKGRSMGVFLQKYLWLFYSLYLFIYTIGLLILKIDIPTSDSWVSSWLYPFFSFLYGDYNAQAATLTNPQMNVILVILGISSIIVFWMFFLHNGKVVAYLRKDILEADLNKMKDEATRARIWEKAHADITQDIKDKNY